MNYELAKKLKEAGFRQGFNPPFDFFYPEIEDNEIEDNDGGIQHCSGQEVDSGCYGLGIDRGKIESWSFDHKYDGKEVNILIQVPTLSELIEACGENIKAIEFLHDMNLVRVISNDSIGVVGEGITPEEAVANLWLKLNETPNKKVELPENNHTQMEEDKKIETPEESEKTEEKTDEAEKPEN